MSLSRWRGLIASLARRAAQARTPRIGRWDGAAESLPAELLKDLDGDATRAAGYLARAVSARGRFQYRINLDDDVPRSRGYNILRHAGAIYALADYLEDHPDENVRSATLRAASYLKTCSLSPVPDHRDALAIWSTPEVSGRAAALVAKLGGTGLGLVALVALERLDPDFTSVDVLRGMARFVIYMQKDDGSFYSKYLPAAGGRSDRWTSLYYPGEAALGLLMLHELDPDDQWLYAASRALGYLARSRRDLSEVPADHWALVATAKLLHCASKAGASVDEPALAHHAQQIGAGILRQQILSHPVSRYVGGFSPDGRTTPTATRLEGLLALLGMPLSAEGSGRTQLRESTWLALQFLRRALVRHGEHAGAMPRAVLPLASDDTEQCRRFNRRVREIRIDYVQHALSGFLEYARIERAARSKDHCH